MIHRNYHICVQAEQTALRNELELMKAASSSDEVTPKRPRKKKVKRALTVSLVFKVYYCVHVHVTHHVY